MPSRALHTPSRESYYAMDQTPLTPKHTFICPICKNPMELVTPRITCNYFRHETGHEHGTEPESQAHLAMKEWIVKSARIAKLDAITEVIIQTVDKINEADVLIPDLKLIIECQCSPISFEKFKERTMNYSENGFEVYWILGGDLLRENGEQNQIKQLEESIRDYIKHPLRYYDGEWYWAGFHSIHIGKEKKGSFFLEQHILSTELICKKETRLNPVMQIYVDKKARREEDEIDKMIEGSYRRIN
jgi:competence CoiA-like predicted nuclease